MRKFFQDPDIGESKDNINVMCKYNSEMEKWTPVDISSQRLDNMESIQNVEISV